MGDAAVILGDDFQYLDGLTGEQWDLPRYIADLRENPAPALVIDELAIHVAGDTATVSGRASSSERQGRGNRYLDSYTRYDGQWVCVPACVWPLAGSAGDTPAACCGPSSLRRDRTSPVSRWPGLGRHRRRSTSS